MRRRSPTSSALLLALALSTLGLACSAAPEAAPPRSASPTESAPSAAPTVESVPSLRLGATFPPPKPHAVPVPRVIDVPAGCEGAALRLDATLTSCACAEQDTKVAADGHVMVRAGTSCGAPHADEAGPPPRLTLTPESPTVAPGGVARVTVTLENDGPRARRYRVEDRRLAARFVNADGSLLPAIHGWDGSYREEALVALPPGGKAVLVLEAAATQETPATGKSPLPRGKYAIELRLGSLGGTKLVPVEVR